MPEVNNGKISIVIPVFNEEESIPVLVEKIKGVLLPPNSYEIIFVDDGSTDNTLDVVKKISLENKKVFYISFSRNFGHQNSLRAGIDVASGDAIITMDGDLQHPPELIPKMVEKWKAGFEVVLTSRSSSQDISRFKQYTSGLYYLFLNRVADVNLDQGAADFRLLDRKVVLSLRRYNENAIFYRGLVNWIGYRQCQLSYMPNTREFGCSKYSLRKMVRLAIDGVTSFSVMPLRLGTIAGITLSMLSFLYVLYALFIKLFTDNAVSGWLSIMAGIYFLGGIQLVFLGLHGEYIGKIFMEVKKRPNYIVSETNIYLSNMKAD